MRIVKNSGSDRVLDALRPLLSPGAGLDVATSGFSLFAYGALRPLLDQVSRCRMGLSSTDDPGLLGDDADRAARNQLQARWLARRCIEWLDRAADVRDAGARLPQSAYVVAHAAAGERAAITGACAFTTDGLGLVPGQQLGLVQRAESSQEASMLAEWFSAIWDRLTATPAAKQHLLERLHELALFRAPSVVYHLILYHLFKDLGDTLDEERIVKSATGIRDTVVWKKLYRFQRDGAIGAIDKLERLGGCIIADSVGLGKTFEALAVIKYYELRNDRVLVLCPKRLRDNWTLYKSNDRRNVLAADRLHYDVLNHTDLSRNEGMSGDMDLTHVNWGNYDLVVIDESHNFRNKGNYKNRDTRYDHLMKRIIKAGVKTRVLMLSATPVNNRLADLKNQIAFATEADDGALSAHGIPSVETTVRRAQAQFNAWLTLPEESRTSAALMDRLGFDYFKLLDLLTIARSRKHIQKYYGTAETGEFPLRRRPVNIKADVDLSSAFPRIREINAEIRRLTLAAYAPLRYVLAEKKPAYDARYSVKIRGGESIFRQVDREESVIQLLRINLLKRMESSVSSFALTVQRQLADVEALLGRLDSHDDAVEELAIDDIDLDDPTFESLLVGRRVRVLLQDVDRVRWRQDLVEDRGRLATLLAAARDVDASRDAKLAELRRLIAAKCREPLNPGNRKVLVFTAFADTATYLYRELAPWALAELGVRAALVTGTGSNRTNADGLRTSLASILTAFAPRSKERPAELAGEGEIDLLIATDCISEGQNLQDCDFLVNYDIHWNPVRIIQRFGRVDRIGSPNASVQLVNFWPNMELEEYINLEQRVSGRMVLLDISATGEENVIEQQSGDQMNDLEYRRKQLQRLQDAVIDLEDLSSAVSITDLTLNDFRIELARVLADQPGRLEAMPLGGSAVVTMAFGDPDIGAGTIFCLRAVGERSSEVAGGDIRWRRTTWCTWARTARCCCRTSTPSSCWTGSSDSPRAATWWTQTPAGASTGPHGAARTCRGPARSLRPPWPRSLARSRSVPSPACSSRGARTPGRGSLRESATSRSWPGWRSCRMVRRPRTPHPVGESRTGAAAAEQLLAALALSEQAAVDQRIPKRLLEQHGTPTAADRRLIRDDIEEARWVAALKPATVGIPVYRDEVREYLEIAILRVTCREIARAERLTALIHRAIPYPTVLVMEHPAHATLSLAHKRHSQGERGSWVVEEVESAVLAVGAADSPAESDFLASLPLAAQPSRHLLATYQGWMDRVTALAAARLSGHYLVRSSAAERGDDRRATLAEHGELARQVAALRALAEKEVQIARQVELNLAIRRLDRRLAELIATL